MLILLGCNWSSIAQTTPFTTPGGPFTYTVGPGVTAIGIDMAGAQGGKSQSSAGGKGGRVQATLAVTPGQVLNIYVGGVGTGNNNSSGAAGGVNGGGNGYYFGGGGGGASDIRIGGTALTNRIIVGGGGAGSGYNCGTTNGETGGAGGTAPCQDGANCGSISLCVGGQGAQVSAGGLGATCYFGGAPFAGTLGQGGSNNGNTLYGGGGGGGYYGGGCGAYGGGGGGSSYFSGAGVSSATSTANYQSGNGYVNICSPNVGLIFGNTPVCVGSVMTLSGTGSGGVWTSGTPSIAAIDASGNVTGVSAGTAGITYSVNVAGCGSGFVTAIVTVNAAPSPIAGTMSACPGTSTTLTDAGGGTWSSSNTSLATVGSLTGTVAGIAAGNPRITYTLPVTGCFAIANLTVNPLPQPITGPSAVCAAGGTIALNDASLGGTWSSSAPSNATVAGTGVVTGVAAGPANIIYTMPTGCSISTTITVNPLPSPITGVASACEGFTTSLSNTGGGTWSTGNPSIASVVPTSGLVTGVTAGTAAITYTLPTTCAISTNVVINPTPAPITGVTTVCSGSTTTLADATPAGSWSTSNPTLATVVGTGDVTGVSAGTVTITYTLVTTGCRTTTNVNVTALPTVYNVTGGGGYCVGTPGAHVGLNFANSGINYKLYNGTTLVTTIGGSNSGLDFGYQTATGTYTVVAINSSSSCTSPMSGSAVITVNPLPNVYTVGGGGAYCPGGTGIHVTLSNSDASSNYQLFINGVAAGPAIPGLGTSIDFGIQTLAGTYTVVATNPLTGCSSNMAGSAVVSLNPLPTVYNVTGGGGYCIGTAGVPVDLAGSDISATYQLYLAGAPVGAPVAGSGSILHFGLKTATGGYTVIATNATTGCVNNMNGTATVTANSLPNIYNVTGGGGYCAGDAGAHVGLNFSNTGVNYQLFLGATPVTTVAGTNAGLDFGAQPAIGTYTVKATDASTGCQSNMTGSASVFVNALPAVYNVTGGGAYCSGSAGQRVGLSGSGAGIHYQLYYDGSPLGAALTGTGLTLDFGLKTGAGVYTVVASNASTGCVNNMNGSATISINTLPGLFNLVAAGTSTNYCAGGSGIELLLDGSEAGISYQLYKGTTAIGSAMIGTGTTFSFGYQLAAGVYTVRATNTVTGCLVSMIGSVNISIDPLPPVFTMTGGGSYCLGGSGVHIGLSGSSVGIDYQLFNSGGAVGLPVSGTGTAIDFGLQTTTDNYFVIATNPTSGCTNNMTGTRTVGTFNLPTAYNVTGGGNYCSGAGGMPIGLDGSDLGVSYRLYLGASASGTPVTGSGSTLTFGARTSGGTYTVIATDLSTGCSGSMSGSTDIGVIALPALYPITGGGPYCAGGSGVPVTLGGSELGVRYELFYLGTGTTVLDGTGTSLPYGPQTGAGGYDVVATDTITGCHSNMVGTAVVSIVPQPSAQTVIGGGSYCAGGTGRTVGIGSSETGITYQLKYGSSLVGTAIAGTSGPINFGSQTGGGSYTVIASPGGICETNMTGSVSVAVDPLPTTYSLTGGGSLCYAGTGVAIGLSGSQSSVKYQLYVGSTPSGGLVVGTGSPLAFGLYTTAGTYTISASDTVTGCSSSFTGSVSVNTLPLPRAYNVEGGGSYCNGGAGVHVTLSGSNTNINYQLYHGATSVGTLHAGTGTNIDFGAQTAAGTYTIIATDAATGCTNNMNDTASVAVDPILTPIVNITATPSLNIVKGQRDTLVANTTTVSAGSNPTYQWYLNGFQIPGATNSKYISNRFANNDTMTCKVTSSGPCGGVTTGSTVIVHVGSNTGFQQISASNMSMSVVPNPSKGTFSLIGDMGTTDDVELSIEVTDLLGHSIYTGKSIANGGNVDTKVQLGSNVANGMYILSVRTAEEIKVFHIVIEQ